MKGVEFIAVLFINIFILCICYYKVYTTQKQLLKQYNENLKESYKQVDVIMINALKITIDNCVLREDYEQANESKKMLSKYLNNNHE